MANLDEKSSSSSSCNTENFQDELKNENLELNDNNTNNIDENNILNTAASPNQNSTENSQQQQVQQETTSEYNCNKKRKYDDQLNENKDYSLNGNNNNNNNSNNKRNNSNRKSINNNNSIITGDEDIYFKLLIPSSAAGGVIGRGGEKIAQIQKDANVRMKMSKANDYYPNTNERVCLIIGSVKSVLKAHEYIIERVQEKPDSNKTQSLADEERYNQIKILIPNTTAGLLIGKGGAYIKQIKDESGAFVQISSKQTDLPERIVTIDGDAETRNKALCLVVKKIAEDPQHNSVTNLSYSSANNINSSNIDPTLASSYANNNINNNNPNMNHNMNSNNNNQSNVNKYDFNSAANYLAGLNNLALLIVNCGGSFAMTAESLKMSLRNLGYNSSATIEIIEAINILMNYGLITKIPPTNVNNTFPGIANIAQNIVASSSNHNGGGSSTNTNSNHNNGYMSNNNNNNSNHHHHHDNRNNNYMQQQHHHQQQYQSHSSNHHYSNNNGNNQNSSGAIGNVLQILSNTLGKVRPNKF